MLFSMSKQKLCFRANSAALSTTKKLSKRTVSKQTVKQPVMKQDNQSSVQTLTPSKMSKKLAQFFVSESDKTSDSFKIKLEILMFDESESLSNESD